MRDRLRALAQAIDTRDVQIYLGLGLVAWGLAQWWAPAGLISLGGGLFYIGALHGHIAKRIRGD